MDTAIVFNVLLLENGKEIVTGIYWELVNGDTDVIISDAFCLLELFKFWYELSTVEELR